MKKLILGAGINDADQPVYSYLNGKRHVCPFYSRWLNLMTRCYGRLTGLKFDAYKDCKVCDEWLNFSDFKQWMEAQDWQGKELDKDILLAGNKIYSPTTCVFVDKAVNAFILDSKASRGEFPIGVDFHKSAQKIRARCRNPFTGRSEHLGYFKTSDDAHSAWKKRKRELAYQLADTQKDSRVAESLRARYA